MLIGAPLNTALAAQPILDVIRRRLALLNATFRPISSFGRRDVIRVCAIATRDSTADVARFQRDLNQARAVWGQCGFDFQEGGFTRINLAGVFPNWVDFSTAPAELIRERGNCGPNEVRIYYVNSITNDTRQGRSAFSFNEPGYVALGNDAHINLFPHELGHLFLGGNEQHRDTSSPADLVNVMRSNVGTIVGTPQVDAGQCARAQAVVRSSRFTGSGQGYSDGSTEASALLGHLSAAQLSLIGALGDPQPMVRAAALRGLAAIRSPLAQASILGHVQTESDPGVQALAYGLAMGLQL